MTSWMLVSALLVSTGTPGQTPPKGFNQADAIVAIAQVQRYYEQTRDFKAAFTQVYSKAFHSADKPRYGFLWVKKPGLMKWDYTSPQKRLLVCDGAKVWIYDPGHRQVFWSLLRNSAVPAAVSFLWDKGNLTDDFWVKIATGSKFQKPNTRVIWLEPKQPTGSFKYLLFVVDVNTNMVVETHVYDHLGNKNQYTFSKPQANTSPQDSLFKFTPPPGVRVIQGTPNP